MKPLRISTIVTYIGPDRPDLATGEDVRIVQLHIRNAKELTWCSNMNMPLCGSFSGVIPRDQLEAQ